MCLIGRPKNNFALRKLNGRLSVRVLCNSKYSVNKRMKTHHNRFLIASLAVLAGLAGLGFCHLSDATHSDKTKRFDYLIRDNMFAGFGGDTVSFRKAVQLCEDTLRVNPNHSQALVWHGSAIWFLSGKAFQAGDFQRGMKLSDSGMTEMDRAVELDPDNVAVRIPRGASILAAAPYVQGPFQTILFQKGVADYERTLQLQRGYFSKLPVHPRGELLG